MRTLGVIEPVMLIVAGFSRHVELLEAVEHRLQERFGPIALIGPTIEFRNTAYYEATMGTGLLKRYWAFERFHEPDSLAEIKRITIELEQEIIRSRQFPELRPLNLDPGFLSLGKFILATTKDQAHRIYLHGGIFAEVTLRFHDGEFEPRPWTYADWQLPQVLEFLKEARKFYVKKKQESVKTSSELPKLLVRATSQP
ncbi:MAG TPA: DUF4416 family protein [Gemmatales bacterium]|nr:DUF4416 family protein [Gemmatales bacterium]